MEPQKVYTVSQLNSGTRMLLEDNFPLIWVEGEISNLACPSSGHIYFSLKDQFAQVRCAMFRRQNQGLSFTPENGMQVLVQAQVSIYEPRGDYQLIGHQMEQAGAGVLQRKFEALKQKLAAEGLFAVEAKQPLPKMPRCIGVVTSPTGAAVRDVLSVLKRRFASIPVIIYPTQVQGDAAALQICHALKLANKRAECDVLLITRGGGSIEDLWSFNEEPVARAIFASQIPVISGVGHEIDFTIADFVADVRAPTPSAAAELVAPDSSAWQNSLQQIQVKLTHVIQARLQQAKAALHNLQQRLQHPGARLRNYAQNLDAIEQRLALAMKNFCKHKEAELMNLSRTLEALNPLATLNRGYAIVMSTKENKILRRAAEVKVGDSIQAQLQQGKIQCIVKEVIE
ncbi:MAG: exodeoxyribonuclease VII large subunit [Gammaproteobacteria bacterium]|nr:exodeoxyribonuclease VII large subunit [Gammaproteobacteria bacterium]